MKSGFSRAAVILTTANILLAVVVISYFLLNQQGQEPEEHHNGEVALKPPGKKAKPTQPSPGNPQPSQARKEKLSSKESQEVMGFYLDKLEADNGEGDIVTDGLNALFAVANEVQNIALDAIEMPKDWEADYGDVLHDAMMDDHELARDPAGVRRVEAILGRLRRFAPKGSPRFQVHLIKGNDPNAFSIAGGHLYVTTGMLKFAKSDDELAAVIGHEMAHVFCHHCERKLKTLTLANAALKDLGGMAANIGLSVSAPFGQPDELQADRKSMEICDEAGYARDGIIRFLQKMERTQSTRNVWNTSRAGSRVSKRRFLRAGWL
jgi:hypothetical protein